MEGETLRGLLQCKAVCAVLHIDLTVQECDASEVPNGYKAGLINCIKK